MNAITPPTIPGAVGIVVVVTAGMDVVAVGTAVVGITVVVGSVVVVRHGEQGPRNQSRFSLILDSVITRRTRIIWISPVKTKENLVFIAPLVLQP